MYAHRRVFPQFTKGNNIFDLLFASQPGKRNNSKKNLLLKEQKRSVDLLGLMPQRRDSELTMAELCPFGRLNTTETMVCLNRIRALDNKEYLMIVFLFLIETICCDPSSEPSRRDGSDEGSQHMFSSKINKKYILNCHQILPLT